MGRLTQALAYANVDSDNLKSDYFKSLLTHITVPSNIKGNEDNDYIRCRKIVQKNKKDYEREQAKT